VFNEAGKGGSFAQETTLFRLSCVGEKEGKAALEDKGRQVARGGGDASGKKENKNWTLIARGGGGEEKKKTNGLLFFRLPELLPKKRDREWATLFPRKGNAILH